MKDVVNKKHKSELPNYFFRHIATNWFFFGKILNYPKCCIISFQKYGGGLRCSADEDRQYESSILSGTGYIPCKKCMCKNHTSLLEKINKKRPKNIGPLVPYFKKRKVFPFIRLISLQNRK